MDGAKEDLMDMFRVHKLEEIQVEIFPLFCYDCPLVHFRPFFVDKLISKTYCVSWDMKGARLIKVDSKDRARRKMV